jgi:hypothetical protein
VEQLEEVLLHLMYVFILKTNFHANFKWYTEWKKSLPDLPQLPEWAKYDGSPFVKIAEHYDTLKEKWAKDDHPVNEWKRRLKEIRENWIRDMEKSKGQRITMFLPMPNLLTGSSDLLPVEDSTSLQGLMTHNLDI